MVDRDVLKFESLSVGMLVVFDECKSIMIVKKDDLGFDTVQCDHSNCKERTKCHGIVSLVYYSDDKMHEGKHCGCDRAAVHAYVRVV